MTSQVFLTTGLDIDAATLQMGQDAHLGGDEGRHALVKRIARGEKIDLVDGKGLRLACEVTSCEASGVRIRVVSRNVEDKASPRITLVQALAKGGRDEQAVETATEVGVDHVIPWQANRSIVRWNATRATKGHNKWESVAISAAKQARRAWIPDISSVVGTNELSAWLHDVVNTGGVALICHEEASAALVTYLRERDDTLSQTPHIVIVVGPEGGISPEEISTLEEAGATPVLLGPHILRSSTAGPIAAALVCAAARRW